MSDRRYVGNELDLFAHATVWKSYLAARVRPYLGKRVLEVGAGFGGTTTALNDGSADVWLCLEPDRDLAGRLRLAVEQGRLPSNCRVSTGSIGDMPLAEPFDAIVYIDVLEHIVDDKEELRRAAERLTGGGRIIVLSPAHQWLFSEFDRSIGHIRRYNKETLARLTPPDCQLIRLNYLDSVGLLASLANRLLLRQTMPNQRQIFVWDKIMVRASRWVDPCLFCTVGKSICAVWRKSESEKP